MPHAPERRPVGSARPAVRSRVRAVTTSLRALGCLLMLVPAFGPAQTPCEARCNYVAKECLRRCAGDSKDASKPEHAKRLMECLRQCEVEVAPCREACRR